MLSKLIKKKKPAILDRWFQLILETYPRDTAPLLKADKDRFTNPVGATISREIQVLYDELIDGMNSEKISTALEKIIRIRSVQDFSPSQAVAFVHSLKRAIKDELVSEMQGAQMFGEWLAMESKIDQLSLLAFDVYMECREKINEIRIREMRNQKDRAFELMSRSRIETDDS